MVARSPRWLPTDHKWQMQTIASSDRFVRYNADDMKDSAQQVNTPIESDPVIEAYRKDVDRSLIRENLRLTVDQRFRQLMELQRFAEELQNAGRKARRQ
jgi:hypothetical protein